MKYSYEPDREERLSLDTVYLMLKELLSIHPPRVREGGGHEKMFLWLLQRRNGNETFFVFTLPEQQVFCSNSKCSAVSAESGKIRRKKYRRCTYVQRENVHSHLEYFLYKNSTSEVLDFWQG